MMSDDELGELLRADLHVIGEAVEPSAGFWDRIIPASRRNPERHRRPRLLAPAIAALAAAVTVLVLALNGSRTSTAYAVTVKGNSVKITLNQVTAVTGLNRELKRLNVPVRAVRMTATCPTKLNVSYIGEEARPSSLQLTRGREPRGTVVIIAAQQDGPDHVTFAIGKVTGRLPACVSSSGIGPRLPSPTSTTTLTPSSATVTG